MTSIAPFAVTAAALAPKSPESGIIDVNVSLSRWPLRRVPGNDPAALVAIHGYKLDDADFARLLQLAVERRLIVQVALVMEDERMMHPLLRVEPVDTIPLAALVRQTPGLRLVLLNALRTLRGQPLLDLLAAGEVSVEISMLEGVGGVGNLLSQVAAHQVLFGSHAPLFYFDSALLKLKASPLSDEQLRAIRSGNAKRLRGL